MFTENIKQVTILEDGIRMDLEKDAVDKTVYIYTGPDFCPRDEEGTTNVEFAIGGYDSISVVLPGRTTNWGAALDVAVDFLLLNDIPFDHCDYSEAMDDEIVDQEGNVIDHVCCGNEGVYIRVDKINIH